MTAVYELRILTAAGVLLHRLAQNPGGDDLSKSGFLELAYVDQVNAYGVCTFVLPSEHEVIPDLTERCQVEVWVKDPAQGIEWFREWSGFFLDEQRWYEEGQYYFKAICYGDLFLFEDRYVLWKADTTDRSAFTQKSAQAIMEALVLYNLNAGLSEGREKDGYFPNWTIPDAGGNLGNVIDFKCAWEPLLSALQRVAAAGGGDFEWEKNLNPLAWHFHFHLGQLGTNRTATVLLSLERGNMANPQYFKNRSVKKTSVTVGGQGIGAERLIASRSGNGYSETANYEEFYNGSGQVETLAGLQTIGDRRLTEVGDKEGFTCEVVQIPSCAYRVHYFLGDKIAAKYEERFFAAKITSVMVEVNRDGSEKITPSMEWTADTVGYPAGGGGPGGGDPGGGEDPPPPDPNEPPTVAMWLQNWDYDTKARADAVLAWAPGHVTDLYALVQDDQVNPKTLLAESAGLWNETAKTWDGVKPFNYLYTQGHALGLKVHAWFVIYPWSYWGGTSAALTTPMTDNATYHNTTNGGSTIQFAQAVCREIVVDAIAEFVAQNTCDGINLDYIRTDGTVTQADADVTALVSEIRAAVPGIELSVCALSIYNPNSKHQDLPTWCSTGIIDTMAVMAYYDNGPAKMHYWDQCDLTNVKLLVGIGTEESSSSDEFNLTRASDQRASLRQYYDLGYRNYALFCWSDAMDTVGRQVVMDEYMAGTLGTTAPYPALTRVGVYPTYIVLRIGGVDYFTMNSAVTDHLSAGTLKQHIEAVEGQRPWIHYLRPTTSTIKVVVGDWEV